MAKKVLKKLKEHEPDDLVREQVDGFLEFLKNYSVVGLAVGFIIGLQAQTVVKQMIESFITPLINVLVGEDFQKRALHISFADNTSSIAWGKFMYVLINFIFVMIFIYAIVKLFKLDKLVMKDDKKKKK